MKSEKADKKRNGRDEKGRFAPGNTPGLSTGRPPVIKPVRELAKQHTEAAILMLAEIMNDPEAHTSARVAAIKEILDRGEGKVTQTIDAALGGSLSIRWRKPDEVE